MIAALLIWLTCQMKVKIATPPMYKTDTTIRAMLIIQGGTPPYKYIWSNGSTDSTTIFPNAAGEIVCRVRDSNGCIVDDELTIK